MCDLSGLGYVFSSIKKHLFGSLNVVDALEEAARLFTKSSFPKRLQDWVLHAFHVFHLFACEWVYNCV
jgi:hypothetical protein